MIPIKLSFFAYLFPSKCILAHARAKCWIYPIVRIHAYTEKAEDRDAF